MTRRPLALLAAAVVIAGLALAAPASAGCQPESCPPPCPFAGIRYAELLCPRPV